MNQPPNADPNLASLRPHAYGRGGGGQFDCPTCGARASVKRGRCMTCGASVAEIEDRAGFLRRVLGRLLRK